MWIILISRSAFFQNRKKVKVKLKQILILLLAVFSTLMTGKLYLNAILGTMVYSIKKPSEFNNNQSAQFQFLSNGYCYSILYFCYLLLAL